MKIIKPITTDQMIGTFLQAELNSSRFRAGSQKALKMLKLSAAVITNPDYSDQTQNRQRARILGLTRGWPNQWLFTNFPADVEWHLVNLSQTELAQAYRLKGHPGFNKSDRMLATIVSSVRSQTSVENVDPQLIQQISTSIQNGKSIPPIILLATTPEADKVILEGHSRSLAYCLTPPQFVKNGVVTILGISGKMQSWKYY